VDPCRNVCGENPPVPDRGALKQKDHGPISVACSCLNNHRKRINHAPSTEHTVRYRMHATVAPVPSFSAEGLSHGADRSSTKNNVPIFDSRTLSFEVSLTCVPKCRVGCSTARSECQRSGLWRTFLGQSKEETVDPAHRKVEVPYKEGIRQFIGGHWLKLVAENHF
jgi:hypothetical protein